MRYVVWGLRAAPGRHIERPREATLWPNSLLIRRVEALACLCWCSMLAEVSGAGLHSVPKGLFGLLVSYRPLARFSCMRIFVAEQQAVRMVELS